MKKYLIFIPLIFIAFYILSCSQKKNIIGLEEDVKIVVETLTNSINFVTTYKDSIENYSNNSKLIVGNFSDVEAKSLLKFENLPDTSWIDTVSINSCEIVIQKDMLFDDENFNIKVYKVTKNWDENSVIWDSLKNDFEEQTGYDFDISSSQDTISFQIDTTLVKSWIMSDLSNSDLSNFGILLCSDVDSNFVEFSSSETNNSPYLKIIYTDLTKTDTIIYNVSEDTFVGKDETDENILDYPKIANLAPTRTIFRFNLPDTLCDKNFQINKAEMIIHSDSIETFFISESDIKIIPYYVNDTTNIDYEYISGCQSYEFANSDTIKINITGIIQEYTYSNLENNQILLKSTTENKDFSYIKLKNNITADLMIIYTKPILDLED